MCSLKGKKRVGHDGISNEILKKISSVIAFPISTLINRSIETGYVPEVLKILPLYKSKEHDKMTNYRPISILPSISKVIEKVIYKRVYSFLNDNDILYRHQYGFRKGHSTFDAVSQFVKDTLLA